MLEDLLSYAKEFKTPIIRKEGLDFLLLSIKKYNVKDVLEVGCAIGYSALMMEPFVESIVTLERNSEMIIEAEKNFKKYDKDNKITLIKGDALEYTPNKEFDLIFIDAAKAQNQKFFLRFTPYLRKGGIVIVDNLDFHGLTGDIENIKSKNLRSMLKKINAFKEWLKDLEGYKTEFNHLGDGMSISIKL